MMQLLQFVLTSCFCIYLVNAESLEFCVISSEDLASNVSCNLAICSNKISITIDNIQALVVENTEVKIYFCSINYIMNDATIEFKSKINSVSIVGRSEQSHLTCLQPGTGLYFENVQKIMVKNILLSRCGFQNNGMFVGMHLSNSVDVTIFNISMVDSLGLGLVISDATGVVTISNSSFIAINEGSLSIKSVTNISSKYYIKNCNFTNINLKAVDTQNAKYGGLSIFFGSKLHKVEVMILHCSFRNNTAQQGGALSIVLEANSVSVLVEKSTFQNNTAVSKGGAVYIYDASAVTNSKVFFNECNFTGNSARAGGGVYLYSSIKNPQQNTNMLNKFNFRKCNWSENVASYGFAVFVSSFTSSCDRRTPLFEDCCFIRNKDSVWGNAEIHKVEKSQSNYTLLHFGVGTLYVNSFCVEFHGKLQFIENNNSAMYLFSSRLKISSNARISFIRNIGYNGGALNLKGMSSVYVSDNTSLTFDSNIALSWGGAIYHEASVNPSVLSLQNCFIRRLASHDEKLRVSMNFTNNRISASDTCRGQSIFLFSGKPCEQLYNRSSIYETLTSIVNIELQGNASNYNDTAIGTLAFAFNSPKYLQEGIIPGKETTLNISLLDEAEFLITRPVYKVNVISEDNSVTVGPEYSIITSNRIKLHGLPGSEGTLRITILSHQDTSLSFDIHLQKCPPGYLYENTSRTCICSANTNTPYLGIQRCNLTTFQANLVQGYWAGYTYNNNEDNFKTSNCPLDYCTNEKVYYKPEIALPSKTSMLELNELICNENREGVLCAHCKENTSVFYHTQGTFTCISNRYCKLGILFYFFSEIIPATVLFLTLIFLDIQLTTGTLNGFLLYMQLFNSLLVNGNNLIAFPRASRTFVVVFNFIVKMFNLYFFEVPGLSYCLFEGANSLHLLAFDYVTVVYSLILVVVTVILLNLRCAGWIANHFKRLRRKYVFSTSIIHGLSGFLVLCYARTTSISLRLLTPTRLYGKGQENYDLVVFFYGELKLFGNEHLKFAIPALLALLFITLLPPLFLILYPLCYKFLACFKLEESKFTKVLCRLVPLERFRPFFDSVQSAFKDKHRYFAGLYFLYRLSTLLIFVIAKNLADFYFLLELQFVLMFTVHAWVQPYKKKWHNRLDLYIFFLLTIINGITMYNYQRTLNLLNHHQKVITVLTTIQIFLAYSPLLLMVVYLVHKLRIKNLFQELKRRFCISEKDPERSVGFSLSLVDQQREVEVSHSQVNYQKLD